MTITGHCRFSVASFFPNLELNTNIFRELNTLETLSSQFILLIKGNLNIVYNSFSFFSGRSFNLFFFKVPYHLTSLRFQPSPQKSPLYYGYTDLLTASQGLFLHFCLCDLTNIFLPIQRALLFKHQAFFTYHDPHLKKKKKRLSTGSFNILTRCELCLLNSSQMNCFYRGSFNYFVFSASTIFSSGALPPKVLSSKFPLISPSPDWQAGYTCHWNNKQLINGQAVRGEPTPPLREGTALRFTTTLDVFLGILQTVLSATDDLLTNEGNESPEQDRG